MDKEKQTILENMGKAIEKAEVSLADLSGRVIKLEQSRNSALSSNASSNETEKPLLIDAFKELDKDARVAFLKELFGGDKGADTYFALGAELGYLEQLQDTREGDIIISQKDHSKDEGWTYSEYLKAWVTVVEE